MIRSLYGRRVAAAIIAGGFAIAVNTIALKAADLVPLATAHGGLLRLLSPALPIGPWLKGAIYAAAVWLLNAAIILPLTGEGFAGTAHLGAAGITWFAAAHTLFFLLLAWGYGRLMRRDGGV
jgi:hypothetical protein